MSLEPTVAILLASYNGEEFLEQQLDSIFSQTYQNFQVYVSDDNSVDATVEILKKYQNNYPEKFFFSVNKNNIGLVKNFEKLLTNCSHKYMFLSDQDDIWLDVKIEKQMKEMQKMEMHFPSEANLVHSDLFMMDENNKLLYDSYFNYRNYKLNEKKDLGHILGPSGVMGNTVLINDKLKEIVLPFPDELDVHDYWIALQSELFGHRKTLTSQLLQYRVHNMNSSNSKSVLYKKKLFSFNRNIKLVNLETNRKVFLPKIRHNIKSIEDLEIFDAYLDYLNFQKNRVIIFTNLLKYSLVKRDYYFRLKLFFKILVTNRYERKT